MINIKPAVSRQVLYTRLVLRVEISSVKDADPSLCVEMVIIMELTLIIRDLSK